MCFGGFDKPWTPPRKPRPLAIYTESKNLALTVSPWTKQRDVEDVDTFVSVEIGREGMLLNSKEARRVADRLIQFANWADGEYK